MAIALLMGRHYEVQAAQMICDSIVALFDFHLSPDAFGCFAKSAIDHK